MTNRVEQVRKIREQEQLKAISERANKARSKEINSSAQPYKKTGCNFCSHCRKKLKNGLRLIKESLLGEG